MSCEIKYLVTLKDVKGRGSVVRVKAANTQEAIGLAAQVWPKHKVLNVQHSGKF